MKKTIFFFLSEYRITCLGNLFNNAYNKFNLIPITSLDTNIEQQIYNLTLQYPERFKVIYSDNYYIETRKGQKRIFWNNELRNSPPPTQLEEMDQALWMVFNPLAGNANKLFMLYPSIASESKPLSSPSIVYIGEIKKEISTLARTVFKEHFPRIINNYLLIDELVASLKLCIDKRYEIYGELKALLRIHCINLIKNKFPNKVILIGDDWKAYHEDALPNNYDKAYKQQLYQGNICLDIGSWSGSSSLYPRSIEILESGGILIQLKQIDSKIYTTAFQKLAIANNDIELISRINRLLNWGWNRKKYYKELRINFQNSVEMQENFLESLFSN